METLEQKVKGIGSKNIDILRVWNLHSVSVKAKAGL